MEKDLVMQNEFTKSQDTMSTLDYPRHYFRWSEKEKEVIEKALANDKIQTLSEFLKLVSSITGRTEAAVYSRTYCHHFDSYKKKFKANEIREQDESAVNNEQLELALVTKEQAESLDSRTIFDLYEKLNEFREKVNALQEENEYLRNYYESSEKELERLNNELLNASEERNRAISHIKSIQSIIINLSQSAFGKEKPTQTSPIEDKAVI